MKPVVSRWSVCCAISLLFMSPGRLSGQSSDYGNWMSYMFTGKFNDRWAIVGDYQWRNYNAFTDLQQIMFRNFAQYSFDGSMSLAAGYAFSVNGIYADGEKSFRLEHRPTQQFMLRKNAGLSLLTLRIRTEQRFIESDPMLFRFRVFGSILLPLGKSTNWALSAHEEAFWYLNGIRFDQNRIFIGLSYRFNKNLRLESGNLAIIRKGGTRYQLFTQLVHTFTW